MRARPPVEPLRSLAPERIRSSNSFDAAVAGLAGFVGVALGNPLITGAIRWGDGRAGTLGRSLLFALRGVPAWAAVAQAPGRRHRLRRARPAVPDAASWSRSPCACP